MKKEQNKKRLGNLLLGLALFCFFGLIYRVSYIALAPNIDGIDIKEFADSRKIVETKIPSVRGNILDVNGNFLAQNVSSYTLIAYLDEKRSEEQDNPLHVVDKKKTAKELAKVINMKEKDILKILNKENLYQVEFGSAGRGLTELDKERIDNLKLPGIDFIENEKRYYPNGDFASYTLGYARIDDEENKIIGEMGLELLLDGVLAGKDGYTSYQKDVNGYKIPGTKDITVPAKNGNDVYLTIDSNIQFFIEQAMKKALKQYPAEWMIFIVADAKTGKILGISQKPSFDNNTLEIKNWVDLTVSEPYEPGSIMKIYTYMAAMEKGTYKGDKTYQSGKYVADDGTAIHDWNRVGFGKITYDRGLMVSSNTGVISIVNNFIDKSDLSEFYKRMGFGEKTGITLNGEQSGKINFNYQTEVYNAAFGQGITTTPMQHIQALTAIANDGNMYQPYIVDKVVDQDGNTVFQGKPVIKNKVLTHETVEKIRDLMYRTVHSNDPYATGRNYKIKGYDFIAKTGTAQLVNQRTGNYYYDDYNSIRSVVGMWPKNDPEVIIYASVQRGTNYTLYTAVKDIMVNVSKYLNIFEATDETMIRNYEIDSYLNVKTDDVINKLTENNIDYLILGDGNKIINQYPEKGSLLGINDKVILLTNDSIYKMPDLTKYSKKEARAVCNMLKLNCTYQGTGYVTKQTILNGTNIKENDELQLTFKELYTI